MTTLVSLITVLLFSFSVISPEPSAVTYTDEDYAAGSMAFVDRDYLKAIEHLSRFIGKKPKEFRAHYYLGLSYRGVKRYDEAIATLRRAAELQPNPPVARYELGKTYLEMKEYEAAFKEHQWLKDKNEELSTYLYDLMPKEMTEQYHLPLSPVYPIDREKKGDNSATSPAPKSGAENNEAAPASLQPMNATLRPVITYRERAKYTEIARLNATRGTVLLSLTYTSGGEIENIRVIRALPDGLTRNAIEAAKKIRFNPAIKDGQPVSVRGNIEYNFTLY